MTVLLALLISAATGAAAILLAGRRIAHVPVDTETTAEARYLAALHSTRELVGNPALDVPDGAFALADHARFHRDLLEGNTDLDIPAGVAEALDAPFRDEDRVALRKAAISGDPSDFLAYELILDAKEGRDLTGRIDTVTANLTNDPTERFTTPLIRTAWTPSPGHIAAGAAVSAALVGIALTQLGGTSTPLPAVLALIVLVTGAIALATVDLATAWLDMPTFVVWAAATVAATGFAAATGTAVHLPAVFAVVAVIAILEGGGKLIRYSKGIGGHGLGDTYAIPFLLGVPLSLAVTPAHGTAGLILATAITVIAFACAHLAVATITARATGQTTITGMPVPALPAWALAPLAAWPLVTLALENTPL